MNIVLIVLCMVVVAGLVWWDRAWVRQEREWDIRVKNVLRRLERCDCGAHPMQRHTTVNPYYLEITCLGCLKQERRHAEDSKP